MFDFDACVCLRVWQRRVLNWYLARRAHRIASRDKRRKALPNWFTCIHIMSIAWSACVHPPVEERSQLAAISQSAPRPHPHTNTHVLFYLTIASSVHTRNVRRQTNQQTRTQTRRTYKHNTDIYLKMETTSTTNSNFPRTTQHSINTTYIYYTHITHQTGRRSQTLGYIGSRLHDVCWRQQLWL